MVSLVVSPEFSFHFNLDDEQLALVLKAANKKRENDECVNSNAAIYAYNIDVKKELTKSPFYLDIDCGKSRDGC